MKLSLFKKSTSSKKKSKAATSKRSQQDKETLEYEEYLRLKEKFGEDPEEDYEIVYVDEDGNPCDEDGNPLDENGNPLREDGDTEESEEEVEEEAEEPEEEEEELSEEEKALYAAAAEYYEAGCDGECAQCEHYDYCPAEDEVDPDDVEVVLGMTKGDIKKTAQGSVYLAREGVLAAQELKEAMDDIMGGLDVRNWIK